ncbi:hypothetical protein TREMEDRAFT_61255 [Tremella mesenterica DSM 1558]|uniref:uncharacterized protein n=1 Tax=Tremella mesenterica (strain ATCC 24925 / CBS 8224 / DSM 1558 / NBRC 9311 / NRRL Y-6157 / RJB 2259-6 / UBC 559-6) TaxID=578456 RepID=UPI0003F49E66|nr:uncharacterized protein TREMEDRAFT_61255 [Tremella mesenterica DSM 1558]EIW70747.1 hypothetical protein TREMEDRAFT_61255 [Tremella mesenterica DSM 1558]
MGFTRLSTLVLSQSPVEKSSRICSDTNRSVKTLVISRILTLFPLLAALTITLLALLLPSPSIHTGLLSIHPSGRTIAPTAAINSTTLDDDPLAFSGIPPNSTFALNSSSVPDSVVGKNAVLWYGTSGPSMWIGVMQVCSRVYPQADVTCTLSSQAAYHAAFLPLSLGMSLFALPLSPPAPILLLLSSVAIILSILALCLEWILPCLVRKCRGAACAMPWTRRFPPLEDRDKMYSDSDSMIELVDRPRVISSVAEGRLLPNLGFAALATAGLILNIVGVALEMTSMRNVVAAWNAKEAVDTYGNTLMFCTHSNIYINRRRLRAQDRTENVATFNQ